jgi:hypothetical protein
MYKNNLKIPKGQSESVNRRRTDNTMARRKSTNGQTTIIKIKIRCSLELCWSPNYMWALTFYSWGKQLRNRIISPIVEVWAHKTVTSLENDHERSYICVLVEWNSPLFLLFLDWILRPRSIFLMSIKTYINLYKRL